MKIEIENLKAQMAGRELNIYQKADALIEFNKLVDYVNELEQLTIPVVISCCEKYKNIVYGHHPDERTYCRVCGNDL